MGIVEVVRKQLQNWEEMRKRMLAERGKQNYDGVEWWQENRWRRGKERWSLEVSKFKRYTDEWEQQTKTPSPPSPTTAAFPGLCTIKPTLLMTIWRDRRKRRSPTHSYLWLQILFLLEGANREMDKRRAKKGSNPIRCVHEEQEWCKHQQKNLWDWCS